MRKEEMDFCLSFTISEEGKEKLKDRRLNRVRFRRNIFYSINENFFRSLDGREIF